MSWLSELWRKLKRDRTDAEYLFEVYANTLGVEAKSELRLRLCAVKFSINLAAVGSNDARIQDADKWVSGALDILSR